MARTEDWFWLTLGKIFSEDPAPATSSIVDISATDWEQVAAFSLRQLVAPELYQRLLAADIASAVPPCVFDALEGAFELNQLVQADLMRMFRDACAVANGAGASPIILKGGIDVIVPEWSINRSRMVSDLDLMVEASAVDLVFRSLLKAGFRRDPLDLGEDLSTHLRHAHHCPPLWHGEVHQYVELHERLGSTEPERQLTAKMLHKALSMHSHGLDFRVPTAYDRIQHNAAHHCFRGMITNGERLAFRQLLDFYRLGRLWHSQCNSPVAIDAGAVHPRIASAIRISATLSRRVFSAHFQSGPLTASEIRTANRMWRRIESPSFDRTYGRIKRIGRQIYRLKNWKKLFTTRFYNSKYKFYLNKKRLDDLI